MYCAFKSSTFVRKIQANNQIINYYDNEHSEKNHCRNNFTEQYLQLN